MKKIKKISEASEKKKIKAKSPAKKQGDKAAAQKKPTAKPPAKKTQARNKISKTAKSTTKKNKTIGIKTNKQKTKGRKSRTESISNAVDIAQAALREIQPPEHIRFRGKDFIFWDEIIALLPKIELDDHTLSMVALLARALTDLEREQHMLRQEGFVLSSKVLVKGKHGMPDKMVVDKKYVNPRKQAVNDHQSIVLGFRRSLSITARAVNGESRDQQKRRAAEKDIENNFNDFDDDDDLLARPKALH